MATTATGKARCVTCGKEKATTKCGGCSQDFCFNHLIDHRQILSKELEEIEVTRDLFRQTLTEQTEKPQNNKLIQQIDEWEYDSINAVRQTANETREILLKYTTRHIRQIEVELNKLTDQLRQSREENDFYETDLSHWKEELKRLTEELNKPYCIKLQQDSMPPVPKIYVDASSISSCMTKIDANARWNQNGITIAGGHGAGNGLNQLNGPWGLYIDDDDQTVYIADTYNHRIVEWKYGATSGQVVVGDNGSDNQLNQLKEPTKVIVDKTSDSLIISDQRNSRVVRWPRRDSTNGQTVVSNVCSYGLVMNNDDYLYVSDSTKHEVRRWRIGETNGTVVAGGNGHGHHLDQLDSPMYIFVDEYCSVFVSDRNNHRVMKWMKGAKEGIVVAGGQGSGNSLSQLSNPRGVIVDQLGTVYVADSDNHRTMRWSNGTTQGSIIIGGNGQGAQPNQLYYPQDLSFDRQGNIYVVDLGNNRVQRFDID